MHIRDEGSVLTSHREDSSTSGEVGSSARARKASASLRRRKSLSPKDVRVGDEFQTMVISGSGIATRDHVGKS
ncbi:hypothetical protein Tco_1491998 [Tanacetum coccineum]